MELADVKACRGQGGFVWLGLHEPTPQELDQVRDAFGLHELAVEDARTFHLRPKVELYEDRATTSSANGQAVVSAPAQPDLRAPAPRP